MSDVIETSKVVEIENQDGSIAEFTIRKFPPIAGRRIVAGYPITALPKIGDYKANEAIMLEAMTYVSVKIDGVWQALVTESLVNNHVKDWLSLVKLEYKLLEFNCSFIADPSSMGGIGDAFKAKIVEFLTEAFLRAAAQAEE